MKVIGITGPTGAGKSTVLSVVRRMGGRVIDCDAVYAALLDTSPALRWEIEEAFGPVFRPEGGLDRRRLAGIVFADPLRLETLNRVTHSHVKAEVERQLEQARREGVLLVAVEAIALLESGLSRRCDAVVAVLAPPELRVTRVMAREGRERAAVEQRVAAQQPDSYYIARCSHVLHNDGDRQAFEDQADRLLSSLLAEDGGTDEKTAFDGRGARSVPPGDND